jgi:methyl-accepting chemotaxis protein
MSSFNPFGRFARLAIHRKVTALGGLFLAAFVIFATYAWNTLNTVKVRGPYYASIVQSKDLIADILPPPEYLIEAYLNALELAYENDAAQLPKLLEKSKSLRKDFEVRHEFWAGDLPEGEIKKLLLEDAYTSGIAMLQMRDDLFIPLVQKGDSVAARQLVHGSIKTKYQEHRAAIDRIVSLSTDKYQADEKAADGVLARSTWTLAGLGIVVVLAVVSFSGFVSGQIKGLLENSIAALNRVAEGDLTLKTNVQNLGEAQAMDAAIERATVSVRTILHGINLSSAQLVDRSVELKTLNSDLSQTTTTTHTQADACNLSAKLINANLQTIASASEELQATIGEIAKQTNHVNSITHKAKSMSEQSSQLVSRLNESSQKIGGILQLITSIAEQTNLLALNATIEAARAGEMGKGFAVVAQEVKALAKQSSMASEEVGLTVQSIQMDSVTVMKSIVEIIQIIDQINAVQGEVASAVEEQTATTSEISRNLNEAALGSGEIATSISEVAGSAHNANTSLTHTLAGANRLGEIAVELKSLVGRFKIG